MEIVKIDDVLEEPDTSSSAAEPWELEVRVRMGSSYLPSNVKKQKSEIQCRNSLTRVTDKLCVNLSF